MHRPSWEHATRGTWSYVLENLAGALLSGKYADEHAPFAVPSVEFTRQRALDGWGWTSGGDISSASNATGSMLITNPVNSGRQVLIVAYTLWSDTAMRITFVTGATSSAPVAQALPTNPTESVDPTAMVQTGVNVLTNEVELAMSARVTPGAPYDRTRYHLLDEGDAFGLKFSVAGGADVAASVDWVEYTTAAMTGGGA